MTTKRKPATSLRQDQTETPEATIRRLSRELEDQRRVNDILRSDNGSLRLQNSQMVSAISAIGQTVKLAAIAVPSSYSRRAIEDIPF